MKRRFQKTATKTHTGLHAACATFFLGLSWIEIAWCTSLCVVPHGIAWMGMIELSMAIGAYPCC